MSPIARRDSKGRVLRNGERQRKDGRYEYRYIDAGGNNRSVYSWKLVPTDQTPKGKKDLPALRECEKEIQKDIDDEIDTIKANGTTLNQYFDEHIQTRKLKPSTRVNYKYMYEKYVKGVIGYRKLSSIRYSDIKKLYHNLLMNGFKPNSLETIHTILHPIFETAVRDNIIRQNPTKGIMVEIKQSHDWTKPKRRALTIDEQSAFIKFIEDNPELSRWSNVFTVFLGTGMRGGELAGLRWDDCDFEQGIIHLKQQVIYRRDEKTGHFRFMVSSMKTSAGIRDIPMLNDVRAALLSERERQKYIGPNTSVIDGVSGFVFKNKCGNCIIPHDLNRAIDRIIEKYKVQTGDEFAHFSTHQLRHTFCTRFCENETNLKVIQEIMGHANIETTMDVYNEATLDKKKESFANLEGKIVIK